MQETGAPHLSHQTSLLAGKFLWTTSCFIRPHIQLIITQSLAVGNWQCKVHLAPGPKHFEHLNAHTQPLRLTSRCIERCSARLETALEEKLWISPGVSSHNCFHAKQILY